MRICYFTTRTPCGHGETFVLREIDEVIRQGNQVLIIPTRPQKSAKIPDKYEAWCAPFLGLKTLAMAMICYFSHPILSTRSICNATLKAGSCKQFFKNLLCVPKALASAQFLLKNHSIERIHAHWLATTATVAMMASEIANIPWSCTGHRFDVYEHNCLVQKAKSATFIRLIDQNGYEHIKSKVPPNLYRKLICLHLGVDINASLDIENRENSQEHIDILMPANFIEIKGHKYVVDAAQRLNDKYLGRLTIHMCGQGPTKNYIQSLVISKNLEEIIKLEDFIPNEQILDRYQKKYYFALMLPSLDLGNGEHEGIPVSLMEAMSYGIPVISTITGGIPELLAPDCGILIPDKNVDAMAQAIEKLIEDSNLRKQLIKNGYNRVLESFDNSKNTRFLINCIIKNGCLPIIDAEVSK